MNMGSDTQDGRVPVAGGSREVGWLIELGEPSRVGPLYWTGESWGRWSSDHNRACRFARSEDARKVSLAIGDTPHDPPHKIVEHAWGPL